MMLVSLLIINGISSSKWTVCVLSSMTLIEINNGPYVVIGVYLVAFCN